MPSSLKNIVRTDYIFTKNPKSIEYEFSNLFDDIPFLGIYIEVTEI